ncbi:unnamed protein product [Schistosoma turkestanicum]|nr:unnamed protein product [Schistosoma turkestanicum]
MDKQPLMVSEASNSLKKLKEMQEITDGLKLEIHRKEAHVNILQQKLKRCEDSVRETLLYHDKEKDELTRQCITLRGERELALREIYQKDEQLTELQYQLSSQKSNVAAMEIQLDILKAKLDDETKRANDLEKSLIESRSELIEFNTIIRQLEIHYQQELNRVQSTPQNEFKDKIRQLEQKLSDAFLKSENDRYIKNKQTDKNDILLKENVYLSSELEKLRKLAEESQSLFERSQIKQTADIAELNRLKQRENELMHMNAMLRQDVLLKSNENDKLQQQLAYQEKTFGNLLSDKQIQPNLTQEFESLKRERQMLVENMKKINEEIAEQKLKIDRLEKEKINKPLNNNNINNNNVSSLPNDNLKNKPINDNNNNNIKNTIQLLLNEPNLPPVNVNNKANNASSPRTGHLNPVDEAIVQAIQRKPRK